MAVRRRRLDNLPRGVLYLLRRRTEKKEGGAIPPRTRRRVWALQALYPPRIPTATAFFCGKAARSHAHQPKDFTPKRTTPADRRSGFAVVVPPVRNTILLINKKGKQKMTQTKRFRMLLLVFAVLIAATVLCTACEQAEPQVGTKTITVQIIVDGQDTVTKSITTEAAYLREALEEEKLIAGEESQYGLFVKTVNGVTVDDAKQQWWCFTKGGADLFTGVDTTPIADGDVFEITLKTGY